LAAVSSRIVSISFKLPLASLIFTPTVYNASEYLFKSVPSSKVSPNFNPSKRLKIVLKPVPTVSSL
jgi:hypothetical protein